MSELRAAEAAELMAADEEGLTYLEEGKRGHVQWSGLRFSRAKNQTVRKLFRPNYVGDSSFGNDDSFIGCLGWPRNFAMLRSDLFQTERTLGNSFIFSLEEGGCWLGWPPGPGGRWWLLFGWPLAPEIMVDFCLLPLYTQMRNHMKRAPISFGWNFPRFFSRIVSSFNKSNYIIFFECNV